MSDGLDDLLNAASESLRDETAPGPESGAATRRAVFDGLRTRRRRKDWAMASAVAFCVLLVAPTVWAHVTGRLDALIAVVMNPPPAVQSAGQDRPPNRPPRSAPGAGAESQMVVPLAELVAQNDATAPEPGVASRNPDTEPETGEMPAINETGETAVQDSETRVRTPRPVRAPRREVAPPTSEGETPELVDVRERELFAQAHRSHFDGGTPAAALRHWDAYLVAYPLGRYMPEARFNRALTLVRLEEFARARGVLAGFARGDFGPSRRAQAAELLELVEGELASELEPAER